MGEVKDLTQGGLDKIKEFAKDNNLTDKLENTMGKFDIYASNGMDVELHMDYAPQSLFFVTKRNGNTGMCGGMIFHGSHDGGGNGSAPTFSVSLNNNSSSHWEIHT
jgi:hypothetical protein